jgi:hypothetical protein
MESIASKLFRDIDATLYVRVCFCDWENHHSFRGRCLKPCTFQTQIFRCVLSVWCFKSSVANLTTAEPSLQSQAPQFTYLPDRPTSSEHTTVWLFDGGVVHALTIILQLRSDIVCLIFFSRDAIWQRFYTSFMRYLLIITHNKLIVVHSIICELLSLFAAVSLTLQLNITGPWHECNRTPYGPDSGVHGIRFARLMGTRRSAQFFNEIVAVIVWRSLFLRLQSKKIIFLDGTNYEIDDLKN